MFGGIVTSWSNNKEPIEMRNSMGIIIGLLMAVLGSLIFYMSIPYSPTSKAFQKDLAAVQEAQDIQALYWISPNAFLNLDSRNEWYIYESGKIPHDVVRELPEIEGKISATKYFQIRETLRHYLQSPKSELKDFKEMSFDAWQYSNQVNQEKAAEKKSATKVSDALADDVDTVHYWIYSPGEGSSMWDEFYNEGIMAIGWGEIGDLRNFDSKDAMKEKMKATFDEKLSYKNSAHATWQFVNEMKVGDIIFVKKGMHQLVGRGVVTSEYEYDEERIDEYKNTRQVTWTHKGEWPHPGQAVMKTLTDITSYIDYVE